MQMHNPPHPGEVLRELYLKPLNLTITAAAAGLGVSRKAVSELVNGRTDMSRDMAIRLAKAFPNTNVRLWFDLQVQYDVWQAEQRAGTVQVTPLVPAVTPG